MQQTNELLNAASRTLCAALLGMLFAGGGSALAAPSPDAAPGVSLQTKDSRQGKGVVSGHVYDVNGDPILGVTIRTADGQTAAVTAADGSFSVKSAAGAKLTFSYLGKRDATISAVPGRPVRVTMEEDERMMDEVVVTGYQQLSRERATGAFDKIGAEVLESRPTSDLSSALQGVVAGMQASENLDGSVDFLIRGTGSLYASTSPLVVVDGFPIEGSFSSLNPNDVESVTVLKDAAAASIWGARSANGVIVVTTKHSKQNSRLTVNAQAFWRIAADPDLDYILDQADSRTHVDFEIQGIEADWGIGNYKPGISQIGYPQSAAQRLYFANKFYGLSDADMQAGLEKLRNTSNRQQLKDNMLQRQLLQQYNVSLSGGSEKMDNYLSLMYERKAENTIRRGYDRFMVNYNATFRVNKRLTLTASSTWQKKQNDNSGVGVGSLYDLAPYEMLLNDDGSYASYEPLITSGFNGFEVANLKNKDKFPYQDWDYNLLREVRARNYTTNIQKMRLQAGANVKILPGLAYDIKFQWERNTSDVRNYDSEDSYAVRYHSNYNTPYESATGKVGTPLFPKGGRLSLSDSYARNTVLRNQLTYSQTFGRHDVTALGGIEMSEYKSESTSYPTIWGYDKEHNTGPAPYYGSKTTGLKNIKGTSTSVASSFGFSERIDRYLSYYFNAGYMYDQKYGASFSIRYDGSNYVSEDASLRWSPMWSAGLKWNISKETFMKDIAWVDYLTLRATYGLNGNAEKSTSPQALISMSSNSTINRKVASISSYGNPTLRWERTRTLNIGVDFTLLKNHLSGKIDYYNRYSKDVIGNVVIPSAYGQSSQKFNNAEVTNKGIEIELTGKGVIESIGLGLSSTVTFAYNKNCVKKLFYPNLYCYDYMDADDPSNKVFKEGRPVGALYCYEYAGQDEKGEPYAWGPDGEKCPFGALDLHNRTLGSEDFLTYEGTTVPPYTFGWANQVSWRGLSLYVYLTGNFGAKFRAPTVGTVPSVGRGKAWIGSEVKYFMESDGSRYPTMPTPDTYGSCYRWDRYMPNLSCWCADGSFIRLKEVTLSYNMPASLLRHVGLKKAKIFCQGRDLGLLWNANDFGVDPEWMPGGSGKPAASVTFGLNVTF